MEAVDLAAVTVSDEVLAAVSRSVAEIYEVLPLRFENGGRDLVIAAADPDNIDMLTDLGFMLSRRIVPVRADKDAILAAIERLYVPLPLADMDGALEEMAALDSRGGVQIAWAWLRLVLKRLWLILLRRNAALTRLDVCQSSACFAAHVLAATAESGARKATVEYSSVAERFHFVDAGGAPVEYDIPPRWARRIARRIARMARGVPRLSIPKGRIELSIYGKPFSYAVARERTPDGGRVVLRLESMPSPEGQRKPLGPTLLAGHAR